MPAENWGYAYDGADRLTGKFSGQVQNRNLQYTYDLAGNVTFMQAPQGPNIGYDYDALNRLSTVRTLFAHPTYSYDPVGNLSQVDVPGVMKTSYNYDALNRLTSIQTVCETNASGCGTPGTPMASYAYTLGKAGNRLSVTELSKRLLFQRQMHALVAAILLGMTRANVFDADAQAQPPHG